MTLTSDPRTPSTGGTAAPASDAPVAEQMAAVVTPLFGGALPVRLRAWDGSEAGPEGGAGGRRARPRRAAPPGVPAG